MRYLQAIYLGKCHAWGWTPSDKGLEEFARQIASEFRDINGEIQWEEFKRNEMEKSGQRAHQGYDLPRLSF